MRVAVTFAVLLAVVATALVAVCQHSETRRLQYRVWQLQRRGEQLERTRHRLSLAIEATRTPRRLLTERDERLEAGGDEPAPVSEPGASRGAGGPAFDLVPGFRPGSNFEGGGR